MSVNKVILLGHVGATPNVREVGDTKVAQLNLATSEKRKGKDGNVIEETEWHNVSVWGKLAEVIEKYVDKGSQLYVEGRIKTEKYTDKSGVDRFMTRIVASSIQLIGGKKEGAAPSEEPTPRFNTTPLPTEDDDLPEGDGLPF